MSFSCRLDRRGIVAFHKICVCLSRIGAELNIEATPSSLLLRALAPSHAVFALVTLQPTFFYGNSFHVDPLTDALLPTPNSALTPTQGPTYIKCKVAIKQLLLIFRASDKLRQEMSIELSPQYNKMFVTQTVLGVKSKYSIPFESQSNILQADFPSSAPGSEITFKPELLGKVLSTFPERLTEVTLCLRSEAEVEEEQLRGIQPSIELRSYDPDSSSHTGGLALLQENIATQSNIPLTQLEHIKLSDDDRVNGVDLTFNVKEIRAFLTFAHDVTDYDVRMKWIRSSEPLLLETRMRHSMQQQHNESASQLSEDDPLHIKLVVATLAETQSHAPTPQQQQQQQQRSASQQSQQGSHASQQHSHASQSDPSQSFHQKQSAAGPAPMELDQPQYEQHEQQQQQEQ